MMAKSEYFIRVPLHGILLAKKEREIS